MSNHLNSVNKNLAPLRQQLLDLPVYSQVVSLEDLQRFMETHVYAVWDFMSLLKSLQRSLTSTEIPWMPSADRQSRRLINDIVLEEESDEHPDGGYISHFELYLEAMQEVGASTVSINHFLSLMQQGADLEDALKKAKAPLHAAQFVLTNLQIANTAMPHEVAAAFTLGREEVIPDMFRRLIGNLMEKHPEKLCLYKYYLDRHIGLDEEHHTPMAMQMLSNLCGDDEEKWIAVENTARRALHARIVLWNGVLTPASL
jgi:hypothetical protein